MKMGLIPVNVGVPKVDAMVGVSLWWLFAGASVVDRRGV
jgi:hypothetical protein